MLKNLKSLDKERTREPINIATLPEALDQIHQDVADTHSMRCTRAQNVHNARNIVFTLNNNVGDYVMSRSHTRKEHKLQTKWRGPMRIREDK